MLFKNTMLKVGNDYSSNFDFHIVGAGTHGVFPSALIEKKKQKTKQIDHNLVPTYKIFVAFSLCTPQNKLKTKGYEEQRRRTKTKNQEQNHSRTMPENGREENTSHSKNGTIFKRWQKWPFCKGYGKAKWSQMVYAGTERPKTKYTQKLPFKIIRVVLCRRLAKQLQGKVVKKALF